MGQYLDKNGVAYLWSKISTANNNADAALEEKLKTAYTAADTALKTSLSKTLTLQSGGQQVGTFTPTTSSTLNVPVASSDKYGVIEIGYTQTGKSYPVELNNGKAYVTVPWQNDNTKYSAGAGLSLDGTTFNHSNSVVNGAGTVSGTSSSTNLTFGDTVTIPTITYDAQGHITKAGTTSFKLPINPNTDTKVTNTLSTTTKAYVTGTTSSTTNTGTQVFDTGVYLDTTAGQLVATTFKGALSGNASTATALTSKSIGSTTVPVYFDYNGKPVALSSLSLNTTGSAAKLTTSRTISLIDNVTGSVSFDGSKNVEISTSIKDSVNLPGNPTTTTATTGDNSTKIATTAFVTTAIANSFTAQDAMRFKGTIGSTGASVTALPASHSVGDTYKVSYSGTFAGQECEVGDMIIAYKDGSTASDGDWTVIQANIDGAVTGPAASTDNHVATFNGSTGKVIKDSGYTIGSSVPSNAKFTDTVYGADRGISVVDSKYCHSNKAITPGTASGTSSDPGFGGTVTIPSISFDTYGHITETSTTSFKLPTNPNSHYTTTLYAGNKTKTNVATTNGNTYLGLFDDSTLRSSILFKGSGATSVSSDANGIITITSTDTNTNTSHNHSAGVGLTWSGSASTSNGTYTYKAKLKDETANSADSSKSTSTSGGLYSIEVDKSGCLAVRVPWTNTTYSKGTYNYLGLIQPWYSHTTAATGPTATTDATAVAVNAHSTTAGRYYPIEMDSNGRAFVNVPWVNSTYTVNDKTLTLQGNGTTAQTFTANSASDKTLNIAPGTNINVSVETGKITIGTSATVDSALTQEDILDAINNPKTTF